MSNKLIATLCALAFVGVPVVAVAHPGPPPPPAKPHKCTPHNVSYRVSGALVSSSLTMAGKHRVSGTITIMVTGANKPARDAGVAKGSTQTYTLTEVKAGYAHRVTQPNPAVGTRTVVQGTITVVAPKCEDRSGAGKVTIKRITFTPSPKHKP